MIRLLRVPFHESLDQPRSIHIVGIGPFIVLGAIPFEPEEVLHPTTAAARIQDLLDLVVFPSVVDLRGWRIFTFLVRREWFHVWYESIFMENGVDEAPLRGEFEFVGRGPLLRKDLEGSMALMCKLLARTM